MTYRKCPHLNYDPRMSVTKTQATAGRRPKHDPKESEREILEAAEGLLRERPFREVTVDSVMARTGLKRPAFYAHFRDRHDLVLRVVADIGQELAAMTDQWLLGDDPVEDGRATFEGLVDVYKRHGPVLRALADAAGTDEDVERAYGGLVGGFVATTARNTRAERPGGRIGEPPDVNKPPRPLIGLNERSPPAPSGREPQADPAVVVDVLHNIWL